MTVCYFGPSNNRQRRREIMKETAQLYRQEIYLALKKRPRNWGSVSGYLTKLKAMAHTHKLSKIGDYFSVTDAALAALAEGKMKTGLECLASYFVHHRYRYLSDMACQNNNASKTDSLNLYLCELYNNDPDLFTRPASSNEEIPSPRLQRFGKALAFNRDWLARDSNLTDSLATLRRDSILKILDQSAFSRPSRIFRRRFRKAR